MTDKALFAKIESLVQSKPVAIYMKGTPEFPMCGFSAQACEALKEVGVQPSDLASFDVLADEGIRAGIKEFTKWPTIPQVFIQGKFVGGADIVLEMYQSGELKKLVEEAKKGS